MYCTGFNSAFLEERPDSVPSHSSGSVSSLPWGHHTCRLLHKQLTHRDVPQSSGEHRDHNVGKCGKEGSEVDRVGEEWDQKWMEERKKVLGGIDGGEEMTDPGGKGERVKSGIRWWGHGFCWMVCTELEEKIEAWRTWHQNNVGVGKMYGDSEREGKMESWMRDETDRRQESGGRVTGA